MKIISWNVAGFRREVSKDTWDYTDFDYDYFLKIVKQYDPDVVCLQETLFYGEVDQVSEFAKLLNHSFISSKVSPDHTKDGAFLGMGIVSKHDINSFKKETLPYPSFPLFFSDGREAQKFDKIAQIVEIDNLNIINLQLQPIHYWNYNYYEEPGYSYAKEIENVLIPDIDLKTIISGDFQISHLEIPFKNILKSHSDSLPNEFTRIRQNGKNTKSDHILVPNNLKVIRSEVFQTQTDHFMCFTEVES